MTNKNKSALGTENSANFADNTTGAITPAILRSTTQDFIDSMATQLDANIFSGSVVQSFQGGFTASGSVSFSGPAVFTASVSFSGAQTSVASTSSFIFSPGALQVGGSTSGTTTVVATGAASGTQTLQAATDTFVYLATADTLTNKTINGGSTGSNTLQISGVTMNRGQFVGTATNDSATAGNIGEILSTDLAKGSSLALTTGSVKGLATITLTAGDWDVTGNVGFTGGASTTLQTVTGSLSSVSTSTNLTDGQYSTISPAGATTFNAGDMVFTVGPARFSVTVSTAVNLVAVATFGTSTTNAWGLIRARRMR